MTYILTLLALIVIGFAIYVRITPIPEDRFTGFPGPMSVGFHESLRGIKVVQPLSEVPNDVLSRINAVILSTERTELRGDDPAAYVTKSALWRFPDVTLVWVQDGNLHIHAELVYGRSDLGVNSARVRGWLDIVGK